MIPSGRGKAVLIAAALATLGAGAGLAIAQSGGTEVSPENHIVASGRKLEPPGRLVKVGNFPGGAALTPDGRFYWTVSAGYSQDDVQIVSVRSGEVIQVLKLPGTSGGIALDGRRHLAYVSGEPDADMPEVATPAGTPGKNGDVIHVFNWSDQSGQASYVGTIPVPPPSDAPPVDNFPPSGLTRRSWPERIAVSPDGGTLLVALGLADHAAIVDTKTKAVRYVATGSHPFGAAILPDGKTGLVSNRGPGTVSVIDLGSATKVRDIQAGPHLSHPETIALDPEGKRAYVPLANDDAVAVIDTAKMTLERTLSVARDEGAGTAPVDASVTPDGSRLLVAESAADELAVFDLPSFNLIGRIPTADYPTDAESNGPQLVWAAAKGFGLGPNAGPPPEDQYGGVPTLLTTKAKVTGYVGILKFPGGGAIRALTGVATAQLHPVSEEPAPPGTPLRPDGPIKHVFYIVRENRTYDQVLGDDPRGDGDPRYALFGKQVTPNMHALVQRFPLLDRFYADSEASIDGHYWTAAGDVSDYVHRTWRQNYAGRQYPTDAWFYQIAYPQTGFIVDRADEQQVSWMNLGEGVIHLAPIPDKDRTPEDEAGVVRRYSKSDLGFLTPGGCYDPFIGTDDFSSAAHVPIRLYDSSKPAGAPEPSLSRFDCFQKRFQAWETTDTLPQLVYMTLPNDHTNGAAPGHHSPRAMVADNDRALGQVIDLISHSKYWKESAIFVVEDDSQDGMDHQDAHRIPALVASPYAKQGAVVSTTYDFPSVLKSIELILGLKPMNLFDSLAAPMYDAFDSQPSNDAPFDALPPTYNLLEENPATPTSAAARLAADH